MSRRFRDFGQHSGSGHRPGPLGVRLRAVAASEFDEIPPPVPIHHHPVVALSLILMVGALVQIGVWRLSLRLGSPPGPPASQALVHGVLHDVLVDGLSQISDGRGTALAFPVVLGLSMLSGCAWFGVARLALGPPWGLWTGLAWVTHPAFAIVASRAGPLGLEISLVAPLVLSLYWWRYRGKPWLAAVLAGVLMALLGLTASAGLILLPLGWLLLVGAGGRKLRRAAGGALCLASAAATIAFILQVSRPLEAVRAGMAADLRQVLTDASRASGRDGNGATATRPAEASNFDNMPAALWRLPGAHLHWYAKRLVASVYTTADRRFERPLLALQLMWTVPALWGAWVAARYRPWQWLLVMAACFVLSVWLLAALLEPLARNLTPIGGFGIVFGLIGVADAYERLFGRRLLATRRG